MNDEKRPSVYLLSKCECLGKIVDFFLSNHGGFHRTVKDKRAVFLAQIDFWDWEIDELTYSVGSFSERSKVWDSCSTMRDCFNKLRLPVNPSVVRKIESDRGWDSYFLDQNKVTAPIEVLNDIIIKWNKLLAVCEDTLLMENKEILHLNNMNCDLLYNLDKYRKKEVLK